MLSALKRLLGVKPAARLPEPPATAIQEAPAPAPAAAPAYAQARADAERRSEASPDEHWVFDYFPDRSADEAGWYVCYLGSRTRAEMVPRIKPEHARYVTHPWKGEEYFEWIDVVQSAFEAGQTYTFLELGAGWGRWSSRAAAAARRLGKQVRIGLAEAEPQHIAWIHQHMQDNAVGAGEYRLFDGAVSGAPGKDHFLVELAPGHPSHADGNNPRDWYGQSLYWDTVAAEPVGEYFGRPTFEGPGGWRAIAVDKLPLADILAEYDFIDLVDFDTQGTEADAVESAIGPLRAKVRKLHIGTHGHDLEARLRIVLGDAGWICLRDFPCHQTNETPFGPIEFIDGVQTWLNPVLARPDPA